jgi:hypothetical protein
MIHRWRPWARSTGPRSSSGKAVSAKNADKGGHWRQARQFRRDLRNAFQTHSVFLDQANVGRWELQVALENSRVLGRLQEQLDVLEWM